MVRAFCRLLESRRQLPRTPRLHEQGPTLIAGGLGSLGLLVASWLSESSTSTSFRLTLVGRTGRVEDSGVLQGLLQQCTGSVHIKRCNISCQEEAYHVLQTCHKVTPPPLAPLLPLLPTAQHSSFDE